MIEPIELGKFMDIGHRPREGYRVERHELEGWWCQEMRDLVNDYSERFGFDVAGISASSCLNEDNETWSTWLAAWVKETDNE